MITNAVPTNGGNYDVVASNSVGSVTSLVAVLTILPTGPAENLTLDFGGSPIQQAQNLDWNTASNWSDGNPASLSSLSNPGSTYEVVAGARLRSPAAGADSIFPGVKLTVDGSGIFVNNNDATIGEFRFKHASPGIVFIPDLVMNGGELDSGDNGLVQIQGEMDILTNTPIYVDNAAGQDRPYEIDSWLTGGGNIEFRQFTATFAGDLNITGTSNTFSGQWNVVQGCLLGSGLNSLGTNSIDVGTNGALETSYDLNNPNGDLVLNGQMFLHQNDTFHTVTVNGAVVTPGTWSFAQMSTAFPTNFPATWPLQLGSTINTASGSIKVLAQNPPPIVPLQFLSSPGSLQLIWSQGALQEATNAFGPWTNDGAVSPFTVTPTDPARFYRVKVQ